jgi:hypothetical protein
MPVLASLGFKVEFCRLINKVVHAGAIGFDLKTGKEVGWIQ